MPAAEERLYVMSPEEIVAGFMPGHVGTLPPPTRPGASPRAALEDVIRPALVSPPCGVAFSGGRDSSAILAIAVDIARREGLAEPIPMTRVFPGVTEAEESTWQEQVIRHLGLHHWQRIILHDELDVVGPSATARLAEHGVLWPPTLGLDEPMLDALRGGSLIDGEGGDEVLGDEGHRIAAPAALLRARDRSARRHARRALEALAPAALRTRRVAGGWAPHLTWLRPAGRDVLLAALSGDERRRPLSFAASLRMVPLKRKRVLATRNRRILAHRVGVDASSPLLHPDVVHALAAAGGALGPGDRTAVLRDVLPDLLPDEVLSRTSKGAYTRCYLGRHTREFADAWNGEGVDHDLVDADELRRLWLSDMPPAPTSALLQAAWRATHLGAPAAARQR